MCMFYSLCTCEYVYGQCICRVSIFRVCMVVVYMVGVYEHACMFLCVSGSLKDVNVLVHVSRALIIHLLTP